MANGPSEPRTNALVTEREKEVICHIARGLANKEIASALGIAPGTVRRHMENVYERLGISRRAQLVVFAIRHGLIGIDAVDEAKGTGLEKM